MTEIPPVARNIIGASVLLICVGIAIFVIHRAASPKETGAPAEQAQSPTTTAPEGCNIAVIPMVGQLWASEANAKAQTATDNSSNVSAESVLAQIESAASDDSIKGVVLRIDSPGGSPVGGYLIANALKRLKKPSAAVIWDQGDSGAYLAATGATTIIASPSSDIGDIGVTSSYLNQNAHDAQNGQRFVQIIAGTYKDTGNPDAPLTAAEQALLQKNVNEVYENFTQEVAKNRGMRLDTVLALATGSSFVASFAMDTGLIDALGDSETARAWFEQKLGPGSNPVLCE
jgi:protease IV